MPAGRPDLVGFPVDKVMFVGPGAGQFPTARSVVGDILCLKVEIGKRLKEARKIARYTQKQVAEKLLMTQQQYSRFENGIFELNYEQIIFLCKLFDISADFLFGLEEY